MCNSRNDNWNSLCTSGSWLCTQLHWQKQIINTTKKGFPKQDARICKQGCSDKEFLLSSNLEPNSGPLSFDLERVLRIRPEPILTVPTFWKEGITPHMFFFTYLFCYKHVESTFTSEQSSRPKTCDDFKRWMQSASASINSHHEHYLLVVPRRESFKV